MANKPPVNLPPYGRLYQYMAEVFANKLTPSFAKAPNDAELHLRKEIIQPLSQAVWPEWDYKHCGWTTPINNQQLALLKQDTRMVIELMGLFLHKPGISYPDGSDGPSHFELSNQEDGEVAGLNQKGTDIAINLSHYARLLPQSFHVALRSNPVDEASIRGYLAKTKGAFQRPRPATVALMLGLPLTPEYGYTSMHPSFISGHTLQGMLTMTNAYLETGAATIPANWQDALQKWCVDIGDRRVFRGLHFPSDNYGSWFVAAELAQFIWPNRQDDARAFMKSAIENHSAVYAKSKNVAEFQPMKKLLHAKFA